MQNAGKWLIALMILIVLLLIALNFIDRKTSPVPSTISVTTANQSGTSHVLAHLSKIMPIERTANEETEIDESFLSLIPREQIEPCLQSRGRNVTNLLAAFHLSKDTNYLNELAANFPNDPRVQFTVLVQNTFSGDRRKWIDAFKTSAPDNPMGNYLSAEDYFKNGDTNAAVEELLAVNDKIDFDDDYSIESQLNQKSLAECSGKSPKEARIISMAAFAGNNLPLLAIYKRLTKYMEDLQKQFAVMGDKESVENIAIQQFTLAGQIESGDSGKFLINQLVAMAVQSIALRQLDENTSYDFLDDKTPAQVLKEQKDQKRQFAELSKAFNASYPQLTEDEFIQYSDRMKTDGELAAMQWVVQQHPPAQQ